MNPVEIVCVEPLSSLLMVVPISCLYWTMMYLFIPSIKWIPPFPDPPAWVSLHTGHLFTAWGKTNFQSRSRRAEFLCKKKKRLHGVTSTVVILTTVDEPLLRKNTTCKERTKRTKKKSHSQVTIPQDPVCWRKKELGGGGGVVLELDNFAFLLKTATFMYLLSLVVCCELPTSLSPAFLQKRRHAQKACVVYLQSMASTYISLYLYIYIVYIMPAVVHLYIIKHLSI